VLSNSIQQLLLVIRNGRQEVHARTLTSVCKSGIVTRCQSYYLFSSEVYWLEYYWEYWIL